MKKSQEREIPIPAHDGVIVSASVAAAELWVVPNQEEAAVVSCSVLPKFLLD